MQEYTRKNCFKNVLEYLERTTQLYPEKKAFADENSSCTYGELSAKAKAFASVLVQHTAPRMPIPVLADKSVNTVIAFMGIVYAGCSYILLDPRHPDSRLTQILKTLNANVLIAESGQEKKAEQVAFAGTILTLEAMMDSGIDEVTLDRIRVQALDIDPLYTIFTSGSTGEPKGVVISHRSVIDFMEFFPEMFGITSADVIGNQAPFDFDVSVKDIYSTLKTGATMEIIPKKCFSFPVKLLDYLCERKVTTLIWAVSALCIITTLKGFEYKVPKRINKVLFSGEVMPVKHLNEWRRYLPDAVYVNLYGPTEITCNCTYYRVEREYGPDEVLPIGKAFPNEHVFLLDEQNQLITRADQKGEICVSGTALALGYYNNPEQTAKAFMQNPLNSNYLELIYRTGDLAYYDQDGNLYFASRKDFQIKHMGHRIELGEIEHAIEKVEPIQRVCCIYDEDKGKILAFYIGDIEKKSLTRQLAQVLPAFMLPNVFIPVNQMPITKNGKTDRRQLMEIYEGGRA